jgi:hypothetical protein
MNDMSGSLRKKRVICSGSRVEREERDKERGQVSGRATDGESTSTGEEETECG